MDEDVNVDIPAEGGQDVSEAPDTGQAEASYFFEHTFEGEKEPIRFQTEQEFRDAILRRKAFTQKTQELAEQRKKFEEQQRMFDDDRKRFDLTRSEIDALDKKLRANPTLYNRLRQELQQGQFRQNGTPNDDLRKEIQEIKDALNRRAQEEESEKLKSSVYKELSERYEDFDGNSVDEMLAELRSARDLGDDEALRRLAETLYLAQRGRNNPAQIEKSAIEKLTKKQNATSPMPSRSGGKRPSSVPEGASLDEIAQIAKRELGAD